MKLTLDVQDGRFDTAAVTRSIHEILASTRLLAMASMSHSGQPWINHGYYSFNGDLELFVLTPSSTTHSRNLQERPDVAVAIADSQQTGDAGKRGLQGIGTWSLAEGDVLIEGLRSYRERFPATANALASPESMIASGMESRVHRILLNTIRLFDEATFGSEVWIDIAIQRA